MLTLGVATAPAQHNELSGVVSTDGGDIPIVVPRMTEAVASVLAPELVADGGLEVDGGVAPLVAPETLSVYNVNLPAETALSVGFFGLYFVVDILVKPTLAAGSTCLHVTAATLCDPSDLSAFDRYAVGRQSVAWSAFSDVALATSLIVPILYLGLESLTLPTRQPWGDFINDSLVIAESLALTATVQTLLKFAFRRPRPINYSSPVTGVNIDSQLSMPSGHSALVAAATTALTTTVFLRHPESKLRYVFLAAGISLSLATGFARVQAGVHFPTDVITGLLIGAASGFAVPYLHRKESRISPSVAFDPLTGTTMLAISGGL